MRKSLQGLTSYILTIFFYEFEIKCEFIIKCKFEIECVFDMHSNVNHTLYLPRFFLFGSGISKKIDLKK